MLRDYRRFVPAFVLFCGAAFTVNARTQRPVKLAAPLTGVLPSVDGYRVVDQQLSDDERRVAGMTDYVARVYYRDTVPAFTTFVSYYDRQTQGKTIHSPRNCLPGAGWETLSSEYRDIDVGGRKQQVNHYLLKNGAATAVVYYWYQGRGRLVANEYTVKWDLLRDAAIAGHTEEALVRVVVPVPPAATSDAAAQERSLAAANALGASIASKLARDVAQVLPRA